MITQSMERLSRRMAFALRHHPEQLGLTLTANGSVPISTLARALGTSTQTITEIVAADSKGRYAISREGLVRAVQGHSFPIQEELEEITSPGVLFHGTKAQFLPSIKEEGLLSGQRNFVHLSSTMETAVQVAARRVGASVILEIDGNRLVAEGQAVFRAENGVILTETVPTRFITGFHWL